MSLQTQATKATAASKYAAIRDEIETDRLHAWSSAPSFTVGGIEIMPLTLRSQLDLQLSGNAIITGQQITEGDIAAYIWRHHADFGDESKLKAFTNRVGELKNADALIAECIEHYLAAFLDTPNGAGFGGSSVDNRLPALPPVAHLCDEYGAAYGIEPRLVADIDLRLVFQGCRAIRMRTHGTKYLEPKKLREAKSEFLKANG